MRAFLSVAFFGLSLAVLSFLPTERTAEALPAPSAFVGEWKAISPLGLPDAHLSIAPSHGRLMSLTLTDPFDRLFCGSTVSSIKTVEATGFGVPTGPKRMLAVFSWACSDGTSGVGTATFRFPPFSSTTDEMADSSGHVWTRVP